MNSVSFAFKGKDFMKIEERMNVEKVLSEYLSKNGSNSLKLLNNSIGKFSLSCVEENHQGFFTEILQAWTGRTVIGRFPKGLLEVWVF